MPFRLADRPHLLLTLASLFWAGNAVIGRAVVGVVPPAALAQLRWTLAFIITLPFAWEALRAELPIIRRHFGVLAVLTFTGVAAFNTMLYWALQYTTAINSTLMQSSGPLLIGLWSFLLFREPLTRGQVGGVLISLAGVIVVVSGGDIARLASLALNAGDVMVLVAIAIYALYSALLRWRPGMTQVSFLTFTMGLGALMLVPVTVAERLSGAPLPSLSLEIAAASVYVAIFPSILGYLAFNRGVQLIGANRAGPFLHLVPLFGGVLSVIFLGERPQLFHLVGAVLVIGGVFLASRRPPRGRGHAVTSRIGAPASQASISSRAPP
jgi:drug/metabolite transporter (DMT)-like permease